MTDEHSHERRNYKNAKPVADDKNHLTPRTTKARQVLAPAIVKRQLDTDGPNLERSEAPEGQKVSETQHLDTQNVSAPSTFEHNIPEQSETPPRDGRPAERTTCSV